MNEQCYLYFAAGVIVGIAVVGTIAMIKIRLLISVFTAKRIAESKFGRTYYAANQLLEIITEFPDDPIVWREHIQALSDAVYKESSGVNRQ